MPAPAPARVPALAALPALVLVLTGCGGSGGEGAQAEEPTPQEVLTAAKTSFDEAASVRVELSTESTPESGNGVLGATGTLTQAPAFDGEVRVLLNSLSLTAPVISVDDEVFAQIALLGSGWTLIDPAEYGAPDPADFADPETGLSSLLTQLDGLEEGGQTRDGETILTTYTGTLPGSALAGIIPSAEESADYPTTVGIDDAGFATAVEVTGPFFADGTDVTYDLTFDDYGDEVPIEAPE